MEYVLLSGIIILFSIFGMIFFLLFRKLQKTQFLLSKKQTKSFNIGQNQISGDICEILGDFSILTEYDDLMLVSTPSKKPSIDMIGIKNDFLYFIEIKKKGADIKPKENKLRRIINSKNIEYVVYDVDLPTNILITKRDLSNMRN